MTGNNVSQNKHSELELYTLHYFRKISVIYKFKTIHVPTTGWV